MKSPDYVKDLRLITNAKLSWTNHIEYRIKKAHGFYQFCRRNTSRSLSMLNKLDLYKSTILPIVLYASECWNPSKFDLRLLENFNKKLVNWIVSQKSYPQALCYLSSKVTFSRFLTLNSSKIYLPYPVSRSGISIVRSPTS